MLTNFPNLKIYSKYDYSNQINFAATESTAKR